LTRTSVEAELSGPPNGLAGLHGIHDLQTEDSKVRFTVDADALNEALRHLTDLGVRSLVSQPPTLEELFLRLYEPATETSEAKVSR
jgi:ABC-2 type transport system ATP-binding protein